MKDILQDIVAHTHQLGFLPLVKVTGEKDSTTIESMAEDRSVIVTAKTHKEVPEFEGVFGTRKVQVLRLLNNNAMELILLLIYTLKTLQETLLMTIAL